MQREFWRLIREAAAGWWWDRAMSLGAAIAFFTVFSLAPMLLAASRLPAWRSDGKRLKGLL